MTIKTNLQQLQKIIPNTWLEQVQYIHSSLLFRWILQRGSKPLTFSHKSAMVFSPHQDDETFGCGGMIAQKCELGISVVVVFLTDGRGSGDSELQNNIVQIRQQEAFKALEVLGVESSKIYFLQKPDGHLQTLNYEERQQTIEQLVELIKNYQPEEVYVPHEKDCHKDHEATFELVKVAISQTGLVPELLQYPIWLFWRAPLFIMLKLQDIAAANYYSITSVQEKKNRAIASYSSQIKNLPLGFVKRFSCSYEVFFKTKI